MSPNYYYDYNSYFSLPSRVTQEELPMEKSEWGIRYDINGDPVEFFKTKKDAEKRVQELLKDDDDDVDKDSIYLFEVGKKFKVNTPKIEYELEEI